MRSNWRLRIRCAIFNALVFSSLPSWTEEAKAVPAGAAEPAALSAPTRNGYLSRHLQFLAADGINHFRYVDTDPGKATTRDLFYKLSTTFRVVLAGEGTTYLQTRGESGCNFAASYDYTGVGMNNRHWSFNVKSLFLAQRIGRHWEAQIGGLEYDRGSGTEATYADNDGWLEGYRLRFTTASGKFLPSLVGVTIGYAGDFKQPNVFARLPRMGEENYIQILVSKRIGTKHDVSAEFDSLRGIRYTREAVHLQKLSFVVVDELIGEAITRITDDASFGWSASLLKTLDRKGRMRVGVFITDMPKGIFLQGQNTVFLNGDSYMLGQRLGPTIRIVPIKDLELGLFGSARTDSTPGTRYRGQVSVSYHFAGLLNRMLR